MCRCLNRCWLFIHFDRQRWKMFRPHKMWLAKTRLSAYPFNVGECLCWAWMRERAIARSCVDCYSRQIDSVVFLWQLQIYVVCLCLCVRRPIRNRNQNKWKIRKWNRFHTNSLVASWKSFSLSLTFFCLCLSWKRHVCTYILQFRLKFAFYSSHSLSLRSIYIKRYVLHSKNQVNKHW